MLCNLLKFWGIILIVVIGNDVGKWVVVIVVGVIILMDVLRGVIG